VHTAYKQGDPEAVAARYRLHFKRAPARPVDYERLNLNLEHQFGQSWVARISYAGNKGTYLTSQLNYSEQNPAIY